MISASRPGTSPAVGDTPGRPGAGRARPLPPDERRAALIAATLPLVAEHGTSVTTRQIADAAGVAEGTIFRVFADKEELIRAAVAAALDPSAMLAELERVDLTAPLRERLVQVTGILQHRLVTVINLMTAVGLHAPPENMEAHRAKIRPTNDLIYDAVSRVLAPDRGQFRYPLAEVARLLRLLTFSGSHLMIADGHLLTPEQIVSVLLDGVLHHTCETGDGQC
ncbi:MAG TPA: TetR/AcrR family transcriptional regulator [Micromonosporaceae bacterium]|nr:TetR/AcrR family transcriptional regulator [Micromonosporaceae bacterium]